MNAQRRELLEKLLGKLNHWYRGLSALSEWNDDLRDLSQRVDAVMDVIDAALLGDLADDEAWHELLEMLVQEVADGE